LFRFHEDLFQKEVNYTESYTQRGIAITLGTKTQRDYLSK